MYVLEIFVLHPCSVDFLFLISQNLHQTVLIDTYMYYYVHMTPGARRINLCTYLAYLPRHVVGHSYQERGVAALISCPSS